ncbi:hypothetical protein [Mycolicibacterium conceptionense]|uniref:hypothetical protein n=1 Tax=Mycolicibacterium conceptionense TaxID=451644 RepID=UPI00096D667A|nr:hypothetical protein [Mycolicibacterium conceptionense]OMB79288.1 hypothetical protein A5743_14405 [Mycolicibacterium conceptionense]
MTTPVGSIKLDLSIDGSGLPADVLREIGEALGPTLAKINRDLDQLQRKLDQTARTAEKSGAKQTAAAKATAAAVDDIGDEYSQSARAAEKSSAVLMAVNRRVAASVGEIGDAHTKAAAASVAGSRVQVSALRSVTREIDAQAAAWARLGAARSAAASTPTPGGPGRGGGSGGGRGGGRGGGFFGMGGPLVGAAGWNAVALGVGSIPSAATAVTNLAGAVQALGQAGLVLPGVFAGAATSVGAAKLAFSGMGDAVKDVTEALKEGTPEAMEKASQSLKRFAPAAQEVIKTVAGLGDDLDQFRRDIQQPMFEGVAKDIEGFVTKASPQFRRELGEMGKAWNGTLREVLRVGGSDSTLGFLDRIVGNTSKAQTNLNKAIEPLVHGIGTLTSESSDFLPRLADGLGKVTSRFDNWISTAAGNGDLDRWINEGIEAAGHLGETFLNIGKIITDLTSAAGGDGGFLKWLEDVTTKWHAFLSSDVGQQKLTDFFRDGREQLGEWIEILKNIGSMAASAYGGMKQWADVLMPILKAITEILSHMPGGIAGVVTAFLAWKTIGGVTSLLGKLSSVGTTLDALPGRAGKAATGIRGALAKLGSDRAMFGASVLAGGAAMEGSAQTLGGQLLGAGTTIAGGALAGSVFGPVGTVAGAGVGAAIAGITFVLSENAKASKAAADSAAAFAAQQQRVAEATSAAESAMKNLNTSLLDSGGKFDSSSIGAIQDRLTQLPELLSGQVNEGTVKGAQDAIKNLGMDQKQLATVISAGGPVLDALLTNLRNMGPAGGVAATAISQLSGSVSAAQQVAQGANPILTQLASTMGATLGTDLSQVAESVRTVFDALPENVPLSIDMPNVQGALDILKQVGAQIDTVNGKPVIVNANDAAVRAAMEQLRLLGIDITTLPTGNIIVNLDQGALNAAKGQMDSFMQQYSRLLVQPTIAPGTPGATQLPTVGGVPFPGRPAGADGMVIPGYAPGLDIVNAVLAPGEGVLIPEAVRGLGGPAGVYALNSRFRSGLSKRYYADGGVHVGSGALPGPGDDATELGVLRQIRDLLAGKGGTAAPLNQTASAVSSIADKSKTPGGQELGPFGTPLKPRDRGYEMASAVISALGGDPEKWIGADPTTFVPATAGGALGGTTLTGGVADYGRYAAALAAFARTGNLGGDLTSLGLDANDSVIKAILAARNKKKGGLSDDTIAGLVDQVLTGGGYTGTLDSSNTSLVSSLQSFREKLAKPIKTSRGAAATASLTGVPTYALGMDPVSAYAQQFSGGQYSWGASDLANGLSDCSGAVSDLVELITKGQAGPERLFSTADAASVLKSLGAVEGAVPGALQIGWSDSHMRATLPNGVNFESGGQTGQGATYGGNAQGAAGMPNIMSLPANGAVVPFQAGLSGGGGTPVFVTNWPGGGAGLPPGVGQILGAGLSAGGGAAAGVTGDVMSAVAGLGQEPWNKATNYATLNQLVKERNPMALAKAFGLDVPDFTRQGGDGADVMKNDQAFDASGRLFSDTGALLDRTFTNLNAQLQAMREQLVAVIEQTNQKLNEEALEPVVKAGVQNALEGLKDSVTSSIGTAMGQAAAPPIADAVRSAIPAGANGGSLAGDAVNGAVAAAGMASGGGVFGGVPGRDSVPAMLMPGEHVLTTSDVARMGGHGGVYAFRAALARNGGVRGFATGGGVNVNDTVGAEFFGVSQIPIIGAIVNILVRVLLSVLGVQIEARDTLSEMTDEFRQFRGDFQTFDASGRLLNDTSALVDRSQSSEEIAAQERIRILKIVIQALIKYIIEKVIVPIGKAVANAAISAGASAAGAAINTQAPGAGGIVSSLISSAGAAGVDIVAEVGTDLALAISEVAIDGIAELLQGLFPDLVTGVFGGKLIELIAAPINAALEVPLAMIGALTGGLGALFAPLAAIVGGLSFDDGGVARGVGMMPKATIAPERVLSPTQTVLFERMVAALERGRSGGGNQTLVEIHEGAIQVAGGEDAGRRVRDGLLELMS